jgi:hypothetical protein
MSIPAPSSDLLLGRWDAVAEAWVEWLANGNIRFSIFWDSQDEQSTITYSPTDHAFVRIAHDSTTGVLSIQTAGFCQSWEERVSANVGDTWSSHTPRLYQEIGEENGEETPGQVGPIWILPTNPEPES